MDCRASLLGSPAWYLGSSPSLVFNNSHQDHLQVGWEACAKPFGYAVWKLGQQTTRMCCYHPA